MAKKENPFDTVSDKKFEFNIKLEPQKGLGGGFFQEWVRCKHGDREYVINSGAGCGNPYLTFVVTAKDGKTTERFNVSVRTLMENFIEQNEKQDG